MEIDTTQGSSDSYRSFQHSSVCSKRKVLLLDVCHVSLTVDLTVLYIAFAFNYHTVRT